MMDINNHRFRIIVSGANQAAQAFDILECARFHKLKYSQLSFHWGGILIKAETDDKNQMLLFTIAVQRVAIASFVYFEPGKVTYKV